MRPGRSMQGYRTGVSLKKAVFFIFVVILLGIGVLTLWVQMRIKTDRSPMMTQEIANFKETLHPMMGPVTVKIFAIKKESTGIFDTHDIHASRVEIGAPDPQALLVPSLAAFSVQAIDLDQNGTKELLLYGGDHGTVVVWMREGKPTFRFERDLLNSGFLDPTPQDAGGKRMVRGCNARDLYKRHAWRCHAASDGVE
jgi:hypothetical protein